MKETKIAKENVKRYKFNVKKKYIEDMLTWRNVGVEHKQTCQRWLEFLEDDKFSPARFSGNYDSELNYIQEKIIDLKQAIKIYEDAGI